MPIILLFDRHFYMYLSVKAQETGGGWGWWDTAELIPVIGNVIGMVREAKKGNWGMFALNAAFLVVDVVTFGAGAAVTTPLKGGIKAAVKVGAKKGLQKAMQTATKLGTKAGSKQLAKGAAKSFGKAVAKKVDDIAKATGKVCVFACFPKGTLVHTQYGSKGIENIQKGDLVWSWNEENNKVELKKVLTTQRSETDIIIELHTLNDIIKTTPSHPFKTDQEWKDAGDLKEGDYLETYEGERLSITRIFHKPCKEEVFNFAVEDFHTYYVGQDQILVHNACENNIIELITRNMSLKNLIHESGVKFFEETLEISGKVVKGVFPKFKSEFTLRMPQRLWKSTRDEHFKYCTELLKRQIASNPDLAKKFTTQQLKDIEAGSKYIDGLTWHHHQREGVMELVDRTIHAKTGHSGGFSLWGPDGI